MTGHSARRRWHFWICHTTASTKFGAVSRMETVKLIRHPHITTWILAATLISFADVLSNLTQLKTLDLSYNELDTLDNIDSKINFPVNLTELHLTNNRLRRLPMHVFKNVSAMTLIDMRNNSVVSFEPSLLRNVKDGLQLFISGKCPR